MAIFALTHSGRQASLNTCSVVSSQVPCVKAAVIVRAVRISQSDNPRNSVSFGKHFRTRPVGCLAKPVASKARMSPPRFLVEVAPLGRHAHAQRLVSVTLPRNVLPSCTRARAEVSTATLLLCASGRCVLRLSTGGWRMPPHSPWAAASAGFRKDAGCLAATVKHGREPRTRHPCHYRGQ